MSQVIIFSKDRPLQLDATLRSFMLHCLDFHKVTVRIIVKASNEIFGQAYQSLEKEYSSYTNITLIAEDDFRQQVLQLLKLDEYVLWLVDDNIFIRNFKLADCQQLLDTNQDALGYSLRLGENTTYCYSLDKMQSIPDFQQISGTTYKYTWTTADFDFGYPLEVSSSLYRTRNLLPLLESITFFNPNSLEAEMAARASYFNETLPRLLCPIKSITFCNPINKVQSTAGENRAGESTKLSPDSLLDCFLRGERIDVLAFDDFTPNACHQEVELKLNGAEATSPKVSVIIPCFNQAHFLAEAVESVAAQTFTDWECLIVNDGSPDNTSEIAGELIERYSDKRIKLLEKPNGGLADARNFGISRAVGGYILPLDSDDVLLPEMLKKTVEFLEFNPRIAIVYTDLIHFGTDQKHVIAGDYNFQSLKYANQLNYCSVYRREVWEKVGGYNTNMTWGYEDWDFWIGAGARGFFAQHLPEALLFYRVKNESMFTKALEHDAELKAQIVMNHPLLYSEQELMWAQEVLSEPVSSPPLVSVIVPTHNRPDMLKETIQSILDQSFQNFEIIVINDAGQDVSNVVRAFNSPKIIYLSHESNKGLAGARNTGLREARGTYIAYLDDDDIFYPEHLETLVTFLQESGESVAYSDAYRAHQIMQGDGSYAITERDVPYSFDFNFKDILIGNFIPVTCFMHDIRCIQEAGYFDESLHSHEDWDLWIRMSHKYAFRHIKKTTCEFRWREDGTSMTSSKEPEFISTQERIYEKYQHISSRMPDVAQAQQRELYNRKKRAVVAIPIACSIIIPVFNQVAYTERCLEMLYANTPERLSFEVIIVDNASTDDTAKSLNVATRRYHNLRAIHNDENLLFAKACNQGAQAAQGEYLVFLNNDTEPLPGWLEQGLARLKSDPAIGVVGSKLLYPDGTVQHCGIEFLVRTDLAPPNNIWPEHRFRNAGADDPRVNVSEEVSIVTGACLFISNVFFHAIGGFCPDYGMYFEDIDLCMKVRKQNKIIWYEPQSVLVHHESKSSPVSRAQLDSMCLSASLLFCKRWQPEILALANAQDAKFQNRSQTPIQNTSNKKPAPMRVLYDISVLGEGELYESARTGIYRVVEHVVQGLAASTEMQLAFCATQAITEESPETITGCRRYLARHPEFKHIHFFEDKFPSVDIFHSPFHVIPDEIDAPVRFLTVYDLIPILFPQFIPAHVTRLQQITFLQTKPDDQFICISHATKKDLCQIIGVAPERVTITHLAADPAIFHPCADEQVLTAIRSYYGIGNAPYILSLCTLEPRKNIDHVIRAFAHLVREGRTGDTRLVLTGTRGWDFDRIFNEIDDNPELHSRIVLTGYVSDENLAPLYSGATAFVYMSLYEGFGLPPLEAMQCGVPVITSNTSSLPEVVGDAGIMLNPQDLEGLCRALQEVITNHELRTELSKRSLQRAANFSWGRCVEEIIASYRHSLNMAGKIPSTHDLQPTPLRLYYYRPEIDFSLDDRVCCDLVPLILGTKLENIYAVKTDPQQWRFHPVSHNWRSNPMWDGYSYDPDLFVITESPDDADYFVFPYMLDEMIEGAWEASLGLWLRNLPYYKRAPDRHVFMSFHDSSEPFGMDALFFRASVHNSHKDSNSFAMPYPVENFRTHLHFDPKHIKYDVSFVGCIRDSKSRPLRRNTAESLKNTKRLRTFVSTSEFFHGLEESQIRAERRELFITSLSESWLVICPRGTGENSYRFFETLSMGRIPVLLSDDCTLPFAGNIDYSKFILRISENDADQSAEIIASWLSSQTVESLVERCRLARSAWEQYFACPQWNRRVMELLTSRMKPKQIVVDGVIFQLQHGRPFGISRLWWSLLTELAATPLAGRIVLLDRDGTAPEIPGIRRRRASPFQLGTAWEDSPGLDQVCCEENAGLFISTYYTFTATTPSLLMLYDMIPERYDTVGPDAPNPEWRDKYHAIVNSTSFAAISHSTSRDLTTFYPQAAQRPLTVVPCAVSDDFRPHSPEEIAAFKTANGIDRPYFLLVGRRDPHKNAALFFQAFSQLPDRERYAIVMAGGGNALEPELRELAGPAAGYAGFFSDENLSLAYSGAIALVYPSLYEGFGLPILEAMRSGCPVITCQNSSLAEVAGSAALYVGEQDTEALSRALCEVQHPDVRAYLIKRGLEHSQLFSWYKSAELLSAAIHQCCHASATQQIRGEK